jgi:hypothetical protein
MRIYQIYICDNDRNGNPRRLTVEYSPVNGNIVAVREHGYSGDKIPCEGPDIIVLAAVNITPADYRLTRNLARELGFYHSA